MADTLRGAHAADKKAAEDDARQVPTRECRPSRRSCTPLIADPRFYLAATVAVLIAGIAKGGFGGGIAVVGVPLMAVVVSPVQAAAVMLPILMVMDALALRAYWRRWDRRNLQVLLPASLIGTALGFLTFRYFSADGLRALVGLVALVYALRYFVRRAQDDAQRPHRGAGVFWGATAGFTSFSIHAGGPPLQAYLITATVASHNVSGDERVLLLRNQQVSGSSPLAGSKFPRKIDRVCFASSERPHVDTLTDTLTASARAPCR